MELKSTMRIGRWLLTPLICWLGACATVPDAPVTKSIPEVQRTWDNARVYLPGRLLATTPANVAIERRLPVILYLHGCNGISHHDYFWAHTLKALDVAVVKPDSFARTDRRANCDPHTFKLGLFPRASAMRDEEIRYAIERARAAPWVDPDRIIVMGHSEGGRAAMTNVLPNVRGTIISGWGCTSSVKQWNGIPHADEHPLLILEYEADPWYVGRGGLCKDHVSGRRATTHVSLGRAGHGSAQHDLAREHAIEFVRKLIR